jgi:hypothetical protein
MRSKAKGNLTESELNLRGEREKKGAVGDFDKGEKSKCFRTDKQVCSQGMITSMKASKYVRKKREKRSTLVSETQSKENSKAKGETQGKFKAFLSC